MPGGGGGGAQTVEQTNLPGYAEPYFTSLLDRGLSLSEEAYSPYPNARVVNRSADTLNSQSMVRNIAEKSGAGFSKAFNYADQGIGKLLAGGPQIDRNSIRNVNRRMIDRPGDVTAGKFTDASIDNYMNPYVQSVLDPAIGDARSAYQTALRDAGSNAAKAGAFGSARHGVREGVAADKFARGIGALSGELRSAAFTDAAGRITTDQDRGLRAALTNQQVAKEIGMADVANALKTDMYNSDVDFKVQSQNAQTELDAIKSALSGATAMADIASTGMNAGLRGADALSRVGSQNEAYGQALLDQDYEDFLNQQNYEWRNLQKFNELLRGLPVSPNTAQYVAPPNTASQLAGLGIGGLGLYKAMA